MTAEKMKHTSAERCLILFTRYPEPGKTKTRLIPAIGAKKAALLQKTLTEQLITSYRRMDTEGEKISLLVSYSGAQEPAMRAWLGEADYCRQPDGDLGVRMADALRTAMDLGAHKMLLVGSDIPGLGTRILQQAFELLDKDHVVLGPSEDGGFYGIGFTAETAKQMLPSLFAGITWSTGEVFFTVYGRLVRSGYEPKLLPQLFDIDTPEDLARIDLDTFLGT